MFIKKSFKNQSYELFFLFDIDMKPHATKRQVTTQENKKKYRDMIKSST